MKKSGTNLCFTVFFSLILLVSMFSFSRIPVEASDQQNYIEIKQLTFNKNLSINAMDIENITSVALSTIRSINCNPAELIDAINQANANPGADTINLEANCSYGFNLADNVDLKFWNNALPIITDELTINGNGARIISSNDNMRAFMIAQGADLTLNNLEVSNFSNDYDGGAILNQGTLTISKSTFTGNTGFDGGALLNLGKAVIYNSTFYQNSACC